MKKCTRCEVTKELSEFGISSKTDNPMSHCKPCYIKFRAAHKRWLDRNPGLAARRTAAWRAANRERALKSQRDCDRKLKDAAYAAYGGYRCACCGETIEAFLSLDHINNDGANHRKDVSRRNLSKWLKRHRYPEGFQILCMNCNFGKARNRGICPHQDPNHNAFEGSTTSPEGRRAKRPEARGSSQEDEDIVSSASRDAAVRKNGIGSSEPM